MEANASETLWPGMTVAKLCCTVSGWPFQEYPAKMRQDQEWVDTRFLHALRRAHSVNVVIFQAHMDETLVGKDWAESVEREDRAHIAVPVALVNDHHCWGPYHVQTRLQWILSTRVCTQRCVHIQAGAHGVRAHVLTPMAMPPMKTGSLQR